MNKYVVIDCETDSLEADKLWLIGAYYPDADEYYGYTQGDFNKEGFGIFNSFTDFFQSMLDEYIVIFHNAAFDKWVIEEHFNVKVKRFDCTLLMSYMTFPGRESHSLEYWGEQLNFPKLEYKEFDKGYTEEMNVYCERDCRLTWKVFERLLESLIMDASLYSCYKNIDLPYIDTIIQLNHNGVQVDVENWKQVSEQVENDLQEVLTQINELVPQAPGKLVKTKNPRKDYGDTIGTYLDLGQDESGVYHSKLWEEYNPGSPEQTVWALKKLYNWEPTKHSEKTGKASVNKTVLDELDYPLSKLLLQYSKLNKLHTTYGESLLSQVKDGRLYASFNNTVTLTGRLSSSSPNLQNIPSKGEKGSQIRKLFVAKEGHKLVGIDFDAFQMRIFAWYLFNVLGEDFEDARAMWEDFNNNEDADPHAVTARLAYGNEFTKEERHVGKTFNFGNIFGFGVSKAASTLNISVEEAQSIKNLIDDNYPSVPLLKDYIWELTKENGGYVYTLYGRRGFYEDILSTDRSLSSRAERQTFNFIVQGTEADIVKMFQNIVRGECTNTIEFTKVKQVLQVHDEIIYEVPDNVAESFAAYLNTVPVTFDFLPGLKVTGTAKIGNNWNEIH